MRALLVIVLVGAGFEAAQACPSAVSADGVETDVEPSTSSPCMQQVDFSLSRRVFEVTHVVGAGGITRSGLGSVASAFAGLELSYGLQFGSDPDDPSYEVEVSAGATVQRSGDGETGTTGFATRGALRFGPARVPAVVLDEGRGNLSAFPLTMEISHAGEIGARPRMSARPELARGLYDRERVELATRMIRIEGAGTKVAPGPPGMTLVEKPRAWSIDMFPVHAGLDVALQDATRIDATIGGALFGVNEYNSSARLDLLGFEHRHIDLSMVGPKSIDTVWMLKLAGVDPNTGSQYYMGWGEMIVTDELVELAQFIDPENSNLHIGGVGWFGARSWGGLGLQYKREPYMNMQGQVGLEDRISGEVYIPKALNLIARTFAARSTRWIDDMARHDVTAGVALDATYARSGFSSKVGVEVGRTYYNALDNAAPHSAGFGAAVDLTIQHTGSHAWSR